MAWKVLGFPRILQSGLQLITSVCLNWLWAAYREQDAVDRRCVAPLIVDWWPLRSGRRRRASVVSLVLESLLMPTWSLVQLLAICCCLSAAPNTLFTTDHTRASTCTSTFLLWKWRKRNDVEIADAVLSNWRVTRLVYRMRQMYQKEAL